MKPLLIFCSIVSLVFITGCTEKQQGPGTGLIIAAGQMPSLAKDEAGNIHLVYGNGDSIMYTVSDYQGKTFSTPLLVGILPELAASHMRGPQIAITQQGVTIIACNTPGNIFSYSKDTSGNWQPTGKINDVDTVVKEGLMALGNNFGTAQKLGNGSWTLNGCPMDGGGLAINANNSVQTIWNRQGRLYACEPGKPEIEIGPGKSCTIESVNGKNVYAWTEKGEVIVRKPQGVKVNLGEGQLPVIKAINNEHVICIWENDKQILTSIIAL